jgi:uncharacterized protein
VKLPLEAVCGPKLHWPRLFGPNIKFDSATCEDFAVLTVLLLIGSNIFMNLAWYGHLKYLRTAPLFVAIMASWFTALPEYVLQVPANRYGHAADPEDGVATASVVRNIWWWGLSAPQLKILQEIISISTFVALNFLFLKERVRPTDWAAFALIILAVAVMMYPRVVASAERRAAMRHVQMNADHGASSNRPGDSK